jgi:hypothetical protein
MSGDAVNAFHADWDEEGVYFYQAYNDALAAWAVEHQTLGGPLFKPDRMTWIKPSFAWMLYRSGYGRKHGQTTVLRVKLAHSAVAELLDGSKCGHGGGGSWGRVQWDPARDLAMSEKVGQRWLPRRSLTQRAIQIGLKGALSHLYVSSILSIEDMTPLARMVETAHVGKEAAVRAEVARLEHLLPREREYIPTCPADTLSRLRIAGPDDNTAGI